MPAAFLWDRRRRARAMVGLGLATLAAIAVFTVVAPLPSGSPTIRTVDLPAPSVEAETDPTREPVTYRGFEYGQQAVTPTKDRPQNKLWYHDGSWWAVMVAPNRAAVTVHELLADHTWRDTGVVVDERPISTADTLWDGERLFVASRTGGGEIRLSRLRYDASAHGFLPDRGYPLILPIDGTPSVAIAKDTRGRIWATYVSGDIVYVVATDPAQRGWSTPTPVPAPDPAVTADDTAAIIAIQGHIAIMWSDQEAQEFRFVARNDASPPDEWQPVEVALGGPNMTDGHVHLAVTANGRLLAAVKTSLDDVDSDPSSPLILVLERSGPGAWVRHVAGRIVDDMTRPVLVVDDDDKILYLFATSPAGGGEVFYKASALDVLGFPLGRGARFLSWPGATLNDATTSRGPIPPGAPLVMLATDARTRSYYHAEHHQHAE